MNNVMLIGRLTRDPDVRYTAEGMCVCKFSVAIDRYTRDKKETDFPNIAVFGKQAENCEKFLAKGKQVGIEGSIRTGSYKDKDGRTVYTTEVVAYRVEFLDGPKGEPRTEPKHEAFDWGQEKRNDTPLFIEEIPDDFQQIEVDIPF